MGYQDLHTRLNKLVPYPSSRLPHTFGVDSNEAENASRLDLPACPSVHHKRCVSCETQACLPLSTGSRGKGDSHAKREAS